MVEDGESCKGGIEGLGDIICGYFVGIVVSIGVISFMIWIILVDAGEFEGGVV